jgi:hypothetical protein
MLAAQRQRLGNVPISRLLRLEEESYCYAILYNSHTPTDCLSLYVSLNLFGLCKLQIVLFI